MSQNNPPDDGAHHGAEPSPGAADHEPAPAPVEQCPQPPASEQQAAPGATDDEPAPGAAQRVPAPAAAEQEAAGVPTPEPGSGQHPAPGGVTARTRMIVGGVFTLACLAVAAFFAVVGPASAAEPGLMGSVMRWATPVIWVALAGVAVAWAAGASRKVINAAASVVLALYLLYLIARSL